MKAKLLTVISLITLAFTITACDDNTLELGASITPSSDSLNISTATFPVKTRSVIADSVLARTTTGYLGKIKDPETGSYITANFMSQFGTLENYEFPPKDSMVSKINGEIVADSCEIRLFINKYYGDPLNLMKITAYELGRPVEEGTNYYSNYSIEDHGYIRSASQGGIQKDKSFTIVDLNEDVDTRNSSSYSKNIRIMLNSEYVDKDGVKYNNYGTYLMRKYFNDSSKKNYKNSYNFIHNVCPGFYFKLKSGLGNMAYIYVSELNVYFRYKNDSTIKGVSTFAGTEEVLHTTNIINDTKSISKLAEDNTGTYIKTPSGIFTEMEIPVNDIYLNHKNDTLNSAKIAITRINNSSQDSYNLDVPSTLLMIEKDSIYNFFEKAKIANYKNSFLASYSSSTNTYTFNNFSGLVSRMEDARVKGMATDPEWEKKHPNWNKVLLVPVATTYNTTNSSSVLTKVVHDMSLSSTKLIGGNTNLTISVVYSKFTNIK